MSLIRFGRWRRPTSSSGRLARLSNVLGLSSGPSSDWRERTNFRDRTTRFRTSFIVWLNIGLLLFSVAPLMLVVAVVCFGPL